jgi:hypothetical protein
MCTCLPQHTGGDHRDGWTFYVIPRSRLDDNGRKEVGLSRSATGGLDPARQQLLPTLSSTPMSLQTRPPDPVRSSAVAASRGSRCRSRPARRPARSSSVIYRHTPGVYAGYCDGELVYAGRALTKGGIRTRVGRRHPDTGLDLHSSYRRNACEQLLGLPPGVSGVRPSVMTAEQVAAVNEWIASCEVAWITFDDPEEARAVDRVVLAEWRPPLSKR